MTDKTQSPINDLLKDIQINSEAIVSRTISKSATFNLTLFAFDKGQALSAHSSPMNAWVQVLSGAMTIRIDQENYSLSPGQLIQMPAGIPHALEAREPSKMLLTMTVEK